MAFDTIPRDKLLGKLLNYNINGNFFNTIKNIYINDQACLKINNKVSDSFPVNQGVKQGCILSPLLFNIFMSDLPKILDVDLNSTNPTEEYPSCLIWADDIILLSESEDGLNKMLKSMESYCIQNELTVNTDKNKCMIFNKTGRLIRKTFTFNNNTLEIVRSYKYLGFLVTPSGEINSGLNDLRDRAMKAFFKLKDSMCSAFHRHIDIKIHLSDTLIKPILLYASDFWGCLKPPSNNPIEKLHHMACKHILGVQKQTTNIGVLLELGRIPLHIYAVKSAVKNWERIKYKQVNIYLKKSYENAIMDNLPWVTNIKDILTKNVMSCFYTNSYENKPPFIHKKIFQRLSDNFHQGAFSSITSTESKLRTYGLLKEHIGQEKYLSQITNPITRQACTKLRLSNHTLNIEKGRHNNTPKEARFCPFCPTSVETETHFLIECPTYETIRQEIMTPLVNHKSSFKHYTEKEKFQYILSEENIIFTAKFVLRCFEIRTFLIARPRKPI